MLGADILFASVGALAIFAGLAAYQAIDAARWRDGKRGVIAAAAFSVFGAGAVTLFIFASHHATANFWGNADLGRDWECSRSPMSARVCNRDLPAQLQDRAAQQAE